MADDSAISGLSPAAPLTGAEQLPMVQAGGNVRAALAEALRLLLPPGVVQAYAGAAPPPGWLPCDGAEVSRSAYPALFAAIGTAHGAGDGNTTFRLPDLRGRVPLGAGAGVWMPDASDPDSTLPLTARALGEAGGSEYTDFSALQIMGTTGPATHSEPGGGNVLASVGYEDPSTLAFVPVPAYGPAGSGTAAPVAAVSAEPSGFSGNMPPYTALTWIIRV